ncbi:MAG: VacJ family lipoprotein [Deltaproteobacteria bacterium]|nr:VacJ family lipoprotein [Deltaproteobacteria bacterium]
MVLMRTMLALLAALALAAPAAARADEEAGADYDPWQRMNRGIFWFNDRCDVYVLEPVAKGWDLVMPERAETSIANFFANLRFPVVMVNNLLQGKPGAAAIDVGRFMVNTSFGIAGLFDPATIWGLTKHDEDFGQTLGVWGVPPGPYLVLPLLGPSNPRDTGGMPVDYVLSITPLVLDSFWWTGAGIVNVVNTRAQYLDEVRNAKEASLDYYVFARNAYYQRRKALVNDQQEESGQAPPDDLYDLNATEGSN